MTMLASSCGTRLAVSRGMTKQAKLETRVLVLEDKMKALTKEWDRRFEKRLEERFRAEGEMMDERFANLYAYTTKRFDGVDERFTGVNQRFDAIDKELKMLREGMKIILSKLA